MNETIATKPRRSVLPAVGLFLLSPLVAEFLLGDLPIKMLPVLLAIAPVYGGGALLIRELVRRASRGWPSIVVLALAYGIVEEAYATQSLFNPNYLKLNMHLLVPAYIPALAIGAWWTIFVLNLHTAWSISASIALAEAAVPDRATVPWLGRIGLAVTGLLFAFGAVVTTRYQWKQDAFRASLAQFATAGVICVALTVVAFLLPRRSGPEGAGRVQDPTGVQGSAGLPSPWVVGAMALVAGSIVLLTPSIWQWGSVAAIAAVDLAMTAAVLRWSGRVGWNLRHKLALGGGAALAYGWHAFIGHPVTGTGVAMIRIGNAVFLAGAVALIVFAAKRTDAWVGDREGEDREGGDLSGH